MFDLGCFVEELLSIDSQYIIEFLVLHLDAYQAHLKVLELMVSRRFVTLILRVLHKHVGLLVKVCSCGE